MTAVQVTKADAAWRLTLDRPDKLNALNGDVLGGLHDALTELADRPDVMVVVIDGAGRAFSAGADLKAAAENAAGTSSEKSGEKSAENAGERLPYSWVEHRHAMGAWQRLLDLLERIPQVTVASIHGHCIGGAALLAVACDLRVGADDIQVRIPELALNIPLTWAGVPRLAREVGLPLARDLVMTGRVLNGEDALRCGFVQRLVPAADRQRATDELVAELLATPAGPLAMTRSMFSALSRERLGSAAWADADILSWSLQRESASGPASPPARPPS